MRVTLASFGQLAILIGLGVIGYGAMVYPPLAALDRLPRRRNSLDGGKDCGRSPTQGSFLNTALSDDPVDF